MQRLSGNKVNRCIISSKTANFNAKRFFLRPGEFFCESSDFCREACGSTDAGAWYFVVGNWSISMVLISGVFHFYVIALCFHFWLSLRRFIVLGHFDSITARFFGVVAARFHLFYEVRLWIIKMLVSVYVDDSFVCVGACIIASSMMKIRKCLTLFYMRAKPCLMGLAAESIKLPTSGDSRIKYVGRPLRGVVLYCVTFSLPHAKR